MKKIIDRFFIGLAGVVALFIIIGFPIALVMIFNNGIFFWLYCIHGAFAVYNAGREIQNIEIKRARAADKGVEWYDTYPGYEFPEGTFEKKDQGDVV